MSVPVASCRSVPPRIEESGWPSMLVMRNWSAAAVAVAEAKGAAVAEGGADADAVLTTTPWPGAK